VQRSAGEIVPGCIGNLNYEADYCAVITNEPTTVPITTVVPTLDAVLEEIPVETMAPSEPFTEATTVAPTETTTEATTTTAPTESVTETTTTFAPTEAETMAMTTVAPTELETMAMTTEDPTTLAPTDPTTSSPTTEGIPVTTAVLDESDAPIQGFLDTVGNDGNFPNYPLALCQGDCDVDEDVSAMLVLFQL
jgi:hypothetical protein